MHATSSKNSFYIAGEDHFVDTVSELVYLFVTFKHYYNIIYWWYNNKYSKLYTETCNDWLCCVDAIDGGDTGQPDTHDWQAEATGRDEAVPHSFLL